MANEETVAPTEEKPVVGTAYTTEQLNEMREQARLEERQRLQSQLAEAETLRKKAEKLEQEKTTLSTNMKNVSDELTSLRASIKDDSTVDIRKLIDEVSTKAREGVSQETLGKLAELDSKVRTLEANNSKLEVEAVKERRLRELEKSNVGIIAEMVQGSTVNEIEASILTAQTAYRNYFGEKTARTAAPVPATSTPASAAGVSPIVPASSGSPSASPATVQNQEVVAAASVVTDATKPSARKMDAFLSSREELLAAAAREFEGAGVGHPV